MNITLKQVRAFLAVAQTGSFTRAAKLLMSTQSSLSVLIRELERELKTKLLDRTTRKVEVTEIGREFMPFAVRMLSELDSALLSTRELTTRERGRTVVAAPPLCSTAFLPHAIAQFRQKFPGIAVVVEDIRLEQIGARVVAGEFDCGLGVFDIQDDGLILQPMMRERLLIACPLQHALARKKQVHWKEIADYPLITVAGDNALRRRYDRYLQAAGVRTPPVFEVRQMVTMLGMVDAGLGVAIWPSWASPLARRYNVELRPLINPRATHTMSVITAKGRTLSPATDSFIKTIRSYADAYIKALPQD